MNGYRSYFDRVRLSEAQHRRLMEALDRTRRTRPAPKAHRPSRWAAAVAACGVLALAAYPIRHAGGLPRPSAGAAQSPAPVETGAASTRAPQAGRNTFWRWGTPLRDSTILILVCRRWNSRTAISQSTWSSTMPRLRIIPCTG